MTLQLERTQKEQLALAIAEKRRRLATSLSRYGPPLSSYRPQPKHVEIERQLKLGRRHNLLVGGSRSGKTFLLVKHIVRRALLSSSSRHAMFRFRANSARASLRLDTLPKVLRICYPGLRLKFHDQDGYATFPNGSELWWGGLDEKERIEKILGLEFATILINEASQIRYSSVLTLRTRLAQVCKTASGELLPQQELIDLNPVGKGHYTHREHIQHIDPESRRPMDPEFVRTELYHAFLQPHDNAANLDDRYLASLSRAPARYRKRFYEGQYVDDVEGALWTMEQLDHARIDPANLPVTLDRVVVAVDPSGTEGDEDTRSDDVGIVVAGREGTGEDSIGWLIDDATCNEPPEVWGRRVVALYRQHKADRIVAEANFGGAMVRAVIDAAARSMNIALPPVELINSSRGKAIRAEPVSVLAGHVSDDEWTADRIRHAGEFIELEDELMNFSIFGYMGPKSPNRGDAYVFAMTELMLGEQVPGLWSSASMPVVN